MHVSPIHIPHTFWFRKPFISSQKHITTHELNSLQKHVPRYIQKICFGFNEYTIYKAKNSSNTHWENAALKQLVTETRKSYKIYYDNDLPEIDTDDEKSAIYVTHVNFPVVINRSTTIMAQKLYSLRFVFPNEHALVHSIELDSYTVKGKESLLQNIQNTLPEFKNTSEEELKKHTVIISRLCSTGIYPASEKHEKLLHINHAVIQNTCHAGISFALMNALFLKETKNYKPTVKLLTTQMHIKLSHSVLSYPPYSKKTLLPLNFAHKTLNLRPSDIKLDRVKYSEFIYKYPGYFLDIHDLVKAIALLIDEHKLSIKTVEKYVEHGLHFFDIKANPKMFHFSKFGKLFTIKGTIPNEKITGEELRQFLNEQVKDGPQLRLLSIKNWEKGVKEFLNVADKNFSL